MQEPQGGYIDYAGVNVDTGVACWDDVNYTVELVGAEVACLWLDSYEQYGQLYYIHCI